MERDTAQTHHISNGCAESKAVSMRLSGKYNLLVVAVAETLSTARTLARAVRDEVLDARLAEAVPAELEHRVAHALVAHGADDEAL